MDEADLADAIYNACSDAVGAGPAVNRATPARHQQAHFRARLRRFLEDLPGEVSVSELRELLEGRHG
ncbi:hypothetical protein [Ancylobacter lacus]|uniref:hypothetical protein n=1 Tax=Ancylobacter lacus TaxID=2579970 RepID=UPI001BCAEBF7|nr:hypothetical protein [Ancylobacter lacus]MBS7540643.1 hypothetical protein [Ancylobacter lacus]